VEVLIVGGGIAGPAVALALRSVGVTCRIIDARAQERSDEGAFLTLAPNGMNALSALGHRDQVQAAGGVPVSGIEFRNARGRRIARLDGTGDRDRYGGTSHLLRRGRLHHRLLSEARSAGVPVEFDAELVGVEEDVDSVTAVLADGRRLRGDVLIGADGVWSAVRRTVWPDAPVPAYSGIVDCGGWAPVDLPDTPAQQMYFGRRAFFGFAVRGGTAYWFSNVPRPEPARGELDAVDPRIWLERVRELHGDDPAPVRAVLAAATTSVGAWPIYDMPSLPAWHTDRVCLVGDAAHATNPSIGQGASLALEDAVLIARALGGAHSHPAWAFAEFVATRRSRVEKIVALGRRIGTRKATSAAGSTFRDLTLPLFLRMGAAATHEQYSYRLDAEPAAGSGR
jgi:FAD-dependent urate hydroxylase